MAVWQAEAWRLLRAVLGVIETMGPKLSSAELCANVPPAAIRSMSLSAILPPAPPVTIRKYQPDEGSQAWMAQVIAAALPARLSLPLQPCPHCPHSLIHVRR